MLTQDVSSTTYRSVLAVKMVFRCPMYASLDILFKKYRSMKSTFQIPAQNIIKRSSRPYIFKCWLLSDQ